MKILSVWNRGYKYLLTFIDILPKYASVIPLRTETGKELVTAFQKIFPQWHKPEKLQRDSGTEFKTAVMENVYRD